MGLYISSIGQYLSNVLKNSATLIQGIIHIYHVLPKAHFALIVSEIPSFHEESAPLKIAVLVKATIVGFYPFGFLLMN